MITLLGVGHVFDIGRSIRSEILARRPKVVALELDPIRYDALLSRTPRARGLSALALLAQFQIRIVFLQGEDGIRDGRGRARGPRNRERDRADRPRLPVGPRSRL